MLKSLTIMDQILTLTDLQGHAHFYSESGLSREMEGEGEGEELLFSALFPTAALGHSKMPDFG